MPVITPAGDELDVSDVLNGEWLTITQQTGLVARVDVSTVAKVHMYYHPGSLPTVRLIFTTSRRDLVLVKEPDGRELSEDTVVLPNHDFDIMVEALMYISENAFYGFYQDEDFDGSDGWIYRRTDTAR